MAVTRHSARGPVAALAVLGAVCCDAGFIGCSSDSSRAAKAAAGRPEIYVPSPPRTTANAAVASSRRTELPAVPRESISRGASQGDDDEIPLREDDAGGAPQAAEDDHVISSEPYARPERNPDPDRALVSTAKVTNVHRRPSFDSAKIGYLRAGAVVRRGPKPSGHAGCAEGFYEIEPGGFVCVGEAASLDVRHPLARAVSRRADRTKALPYLYGITPHGRAPLYTRIPSAAEQRSAEPDLGGVRARASGGFSDHPLDEIPWFLQDGKPTISIHGHRRPSGALHSGYAIANSGAAFIASFQSGGRRFGLTVDMDVVPLDRYRAVAPSRFHGLPLDAATPLPVVFVRSKSAALFSGDPHASTMRFERRLEYREAVPITGRAVRAGNLRYLETLDGRFLKDEHLVRVDPLKEAPRWASAGRTWLDVSIDRQTLVAYEGETPVFVTLVSTGADGAQDPETTRATVQGQFLVHTKHVSITMSGDEVGEEFDLRDVPYVQYFTKGYALHAAYWHDGFGTPRSHGCINLSPLDARWLFGWSDPPVPIAWHGAMSLRDGTLVSIHP